MSGGNPCYLHADHFPPVSLPGLSRQSRVACSRGDFEWPECLSRRGKCISTSIVAANGLAHHERMSVSPLDARDEPGHDVVVGGGHDVVLGHGHDVVLGYGHGAVVGAGPDADNNGVSMMERRASAARGMVA